MGECKGKRINVYYVLTCISSIYLSILLPLAHLILIKLLGYFLKIILPDEEIANQGDYTNCPSKLESRN